MNTKKIMMIAAIAALIGIVAGYGYGSSTGYGAGDAAGYIRAAADYKKVREAAAAKAAREAAQAANPFAAPNPLQGITTNPFEKAKSILNPFR